MDLMIDLETLDTEPTAVVLSLGAVLFDPLNELCIGQTFYVEFTNHLEQQTGTGRTISPSTVLWWMNRDAKAREVFSTRETDQTRCSPLYAISAFCDFVKESGARRVWAKDPDFDVVILRSLFMTNAPGFIFPFSYTAGRSVRTVEALPNAPATELKPVAHNALEDAIAQARSVQRVFAALAARSEGA